MPTIKPIFLLADSQLLFWRQDSTQFLSRVREMIDEDGPNPEPKAAYLGASNGDAPEFFDLFVSAMHGIGIRICRLIPSEPQPVDFEFLAEADVILLAGGDTQRGWRVFEETGIKEKLVERYYGGALLLGVSAGAVQLGLKGWDEAGEKLFDTLRLVPFVIDVHDEPSWARLHRAVPRSGEHVRGFGIPTGGGALYHPDYSVEPVRHPLVEVSTNEEGGTTQALLLPGEIAMAEPGGEPGDPSGGGEPTPEPGEELVH